jgi:hypothetical protein
MPTAQQTTKRQGGQQKLPPQTIRQRAEVYRARAQKAHRYGLTAHQATRGVQKQVAPFAGMGLLVLASAAVHAARDASDADTAILAGTAATCVVVAVVAAHQMRKRLDDRKSLVRGYAFLGVAGSWLTWTTAVGLSWDAVAVLAVLGTALSLHYLRKVRIPNRGTVVPTPADPTPMAAVQDSGAAFAARWDEYVGCPGGQLPGSKLEDPKRVKAGWRFALRLVPGKQSIASLMSVMILVRGGLGLTVDQDVIAERHPLLAEPAVQLTIVTKPQVRDDQPWPGPESFRDGYVDMGPFIDGEGHARWKAYTKDRMVGGYIQGGSGAGKSRLIESIVMPIADSQTHPTVIWYSDGQGGSSSPTLMRCADYAARNHEQTKQMYGCAMLIMELRQDENSHGADGEDDDTIGFTPTADRPGLLIVHDECHKSMSKIENPEDWIVIQYMAMTIAREGQKVGVQAILASQESTLGAFGGAGNNAEMLRSNLLMGNGVMMRSKDANARQVFKVDDDPSQFPPLPGYALLVDPEEGVRTAPFRAYFLTDELRKQWPSKIRWRSLDEGSGNAAGLTYLMRHQLAEMAKAETRRRIEERRSGARLGAVGSLDRVFNAARGSDGARQEQPTSEQLQVAQFPVWNPATEQVQRRQMHDGHRKILDAIKANIVSPSPIAEATGYTVRRVHQLLDELMDDFGAVQRDGHGQYALAGEPVDA